MTIQISVESYDELIEFAKKLLEPKQAKITITPDNITLTPAQVPTPVTVTPAQDPIPEPEPEPVKEDPTYTITEVRAYLGNLRKSGKKEEVTKLIADMGYSKFTDIPAERYAELMKKAEEL